ncbi:MAG: anthranilate synthase component I, partial [Candidatus Limnocylindria bacterium]
MTTATQTRVTSIELAADTLTPVAAALRLGRRCAFLLESVEGGARYGRYSIVGVHGRTLVVDGSDDPLEILRAALPNVEPMAGDPAFPLASGVGYIAYEATARWERVPIPDVDPLGMPAAVFHLPSSVIVFDHLAQVARVATLDGPGAQERLRATIEALSTQAAGEVPAPFAAAIV